MNAPKLVIFDCDGVLVDAEAMEAGTLDVALRSAGLPAGERIDVAALHARNRGGTLAGLLDLVASELDLPLPDGFEAHYRAVQLERLASVAIVPGAREAVAAARSLGVPRCVASGGPMVKMRVSLGATGLWDEFDPHIFSCYDLGDHKPSPGVYLHALARFGVDAVDALAIEDSRNGVRAAAAAGVRVIGLARETEPDDLVDAGAHETVASMHEVARRLTH